MSFFFLVVVHKQVLSKFCLSLSRTCCIRVNYMTKLAVLFSCQIPMYFVEDTGKYCEATWAQLFWHNDWTVLLLLLAIHNMIRRFVEKYMIMIYAYV